MENPLERELEKKYLKAQRLKSVKELEKEYSKELINLYKEKIERAKKDEEFKGVIELYKKKLEEIEFLKNKKQEIFDNIRKNSQETEKNNLMLENYLKNLEQKKLDFDKFMKEKGKEAFANLKRNEELNKKLQEELHRFEDKKVVKTNALAKAKLTVENFREKEMLQKEKDAQVDAEGQNNIMYRINQTFHNMGNKIDFSTTRFHNVLVMKHNEELEEYLNMPTAIEKAQIETDKLKERRKSTEKAKNKFENETKLNSKEIIRREKAKENLDRLEAELNKLNQARKKSLNKNKMVGTDNMLANAKQMEKKSKYMMENLLKNKMSNRKEILNQKQIKVKNEDNLTNSIDDEEILEFYRDNAEEIGLMRNDNEDSQYINKAILEYNEKLDGTDKNSFNVIIENVNESNRRLKYEEPITRDFNLVEKINRLNPVDFESFNKAMSYNKEFKENETKIPNKILTHKQHKIEDKKEEFDFNNIIRPKSSMNRLNENIDQNLKIKATSLVSEFFNDLNKLPEAKQDIKQKPYIYTEAKFNSKESNNIINKPIVNDIKPLINSKDLKKDKVININNKLSEIKTNISTTIMNKSPVNRLKKNSIKEIIEEQPNKIDNNEEDESENPNEFKRDDTKWKYSKQELYERRKKLLKEKKTIKK